MKFCTERVYHLFVILSHIFMLINSFLLTFAYFTVLGSEIPIYTFLAGPVLATFVTMLYLTGCGIKNKTDEFHYNTEQNNAILQIKPQAWWCHQMETFSALLAICVGNSPVPGEFPAQWPVTRSFDVFVDLGLNKRLSKPSWGWWFDTLSRPLWRHCNGTNK